MALTSRSEYLVRRDLAARGNESADDDGVILCAVEAAKQGDRDAVRVLYIRYADDVQRFALSVVNDPHDAEDVTQNVFAKLMWVISQYERRDVPFAAWIIRVARNTALDHLRAKRQIPFEEVRTASDEDHSVGHDRSVSLRTALSQIPTAQRDVLVLRHVAGLSPAEIAQRLGKSEGSIHGLHHRGRGSLQGVLRDLGAAPVTAA